MILLCPQTLGLGVHRVRVASRPRVGFLSSVSPGRVPILFLGFFLPTGTAVAWICLGNSRRLAGSLLLTPSQRDRFLGRWMDHGCVFWGARNGRCVGKERKVV